MIAATFSPIKAPRERTAGVHVPTASHHRCSGVRSHHLVGTHHDSARLRLDLMEDLPERKVA